jgi:hypothetical protein
LKILINSEVGSMASKRDGIYHKSVSFGGKSMTLYSLDGFTWSSRKDELHLIEERREAQKVTAAQLKGEVPVEGAAAPAVAKPAPPSLRARPHLNLQKEKVEHPAEALIREQKKQEKQDKKLRARAAVKQANAAKLKPAAKAAPAKKAKGKKATKKKLAA